MPDARTPDFRRNELLEELMGNLGADLRPAEDRLVLDYAGKTMPYPIVLVMGPLRSGTTLFMQWLADTGLVAYPSNLLSRFYQTPIIGAKIQLLLTDPRYNFRNELGEFLSRAEYASENGKTRGALAPNEFWYFWRRFLADPARDVWPDEELRNSMDTYTMLAELAGMMDVFQKPFAAKGMLFNYNIPFLDSIFDKALFVQIKRDPAANVASILEARKRQLGSEAAWYSFRIPEYPELENLDAVNQAAGQLYYIDKAVSAGMSAIPESRKMLIRYEDFCVEPHAVFGRLLAKLGLDPNIAYAGPKCFHISGRTEASAETVITKALARFHGSKNRL